MMRADPRQFDMFAAPQLTPRELAAEHDRRVSEWTPPNMVDRDQWGRPLVQTRAASNGGLITRYHPDTPEPFEIVVRGIPCVITVHGGYSTHAIQPAGSLFWSETGFRSMGPFISDPAEIIADIERYIDGPKKDGRGCGGKLVKWWPSYIRQWQQSLAFEIESTAKCGRAGVWDQWGSEKWEDAWHKHDMGLADAIEQMREQGIDPNDVGPPEYFKGKWPRFDQEQLI